MLIACWGSISSDAGLLKIRGESLALQGGDEADQQYSTADDGTAGFHAIFKPLDRNSMYRW